VGESYQKINNEEMAIENYKKVLSLENKNDETKGPIESLLEYSCRQIVFIYKRENNYTTALPYVKKALELNPGDAYMKEFLEKYEEVE
jgi:tetratricopeptide (TPR) repeat protein